VGQRAAVARLLMAVEPRMVAVKKPAATESAVASCSRPYIWQKLAQWLDSGKWIRFRFLGYPKGINAVGKILASFCPIRSKAFISELIFYYEMSQEIGFERIQSFWGNFLPPAPMTAKTLTAPSALSNHSQ
jgi:hypothetical protein